MSDERIGDGTVRRRGVVPLGDAVARAIAPLASRRGLTTSDLLPAWRDLVGRRFANATRPERLVWPKGQANEGRPAQLVVRVDGPMAVFLQHEAGQIVERVNAFVGYAAIDRIRIVQGPVATPAGPAERRKLRTLAADEEAALGRRLDSVEDGGLKAALDRLGRSVLGEKPR